MTVTFVALGAVRLVQTINDFCVLSCSSSLCTSAGVILINISAVKSSDDVELAPCVQDAVENIDGY